MQFHVLLTYFHSYSITDKIMLLTNLHSQYLVFPLQTYSKNFAQYEHLKITETENSKLFYFNF